MAHKLNKNDNELLSIIAEYGILTVNQLAALSHRSSQVIRRRLRFFIKEALIGARLRIYGNSRGRPEDLIFLTDQGVKHLKGLGILPEKASYLMEKFIESPFVDHDLLANWFRIYISLIEKLIPNFSVDYLSPSTGHTLLKEKNQSRFSEKGSEHNNLRNTIDFIPDGVFTITDREKGKTLLFFLEVDMDTETIVSADRNKSNDVRQKILNYQGLFRSGQYKRYQNIFHANLNGFRLLFLANRDARLIALCRLVQGMPPSDFIWLTDQEKMFSQGLHAKIWARGGRYDKSLESILGTDLPTHILSETTAITPVSHKE